MNPWIEEQRQKNRRRFYELLEEGRKKWTPRNIFNRCCVKWLVDGPRVQDPCDKYSPRNGCTRCSRDHPCITLGFDEDSKVTIATISHLLDPFLNYFDWLVAEGKAQRVSSTEYHLDGHLRSNLTVLKSYGCFGGHLVLEAGATTEIAGFDKIYSGVRAKKRCRLNESNTKLCSELSEKALSIALNERLKLDVQHDPLSLYSMRSLNKEFKKLSESLASEKVKTLELSITLLVNGKDDDLEYYDSERYYVRSWGTLDEEPSGVISYDEDPREIWLEFRDGAFYPTDADAAMFSWDCIKRQWMDKKYCGQLMRVYWHPTDVDPVRPIDREGYWTDMDLPCEFRQESYSLGVLVGEFFVGPNPSLGEKSESNKHATIEYEVIENSYSVEEAEDDVDDDSFGGNAKEEEESGGDKPAIEYEVAEEGQSKIDIRYSDDDSSDSSTKEGEESDNVINQRQQRRRYIRYSGKIRITKLKVDYSFLVKEHARGCLESIYCKHRQIKRPLTWKENQMKNFVALASGKEYSSNLAAGDEQIKKCNQVMLQSNIEAGLH